MNSVILFITAMIVGAFLYRIIARKLFIQRLSSGRIFRDVSTFDTKGFWIVSKKRHAVDSKPKKEFIAGRLGNYEIIANASAEDLMILSELSEAQKPTKKPEYQPGMFKE